MEPDLDRTIDAIPADEVPANNVIAYHLMKLDTLFEMARHIPRNGGRGLIKIYRLTLSPLVGFHCRHLPTCSEYSDEALDRFGLWVGGWMTLARLLRCQPFGTSGIDVVPEMLPPHARWYMPWRYGRWRGTNPGGSTGSKPVMPR